MLLGPDMRAEDTALQPSAQLDLLNADLAELHVLAERGPKKAGTGSIEFHQLVMAKALLLDKNHQAWRESLPPSWQPVAVPPSKIHPSIRAAGLYEGICEVYSSLEVSHVHNAARSSHFDVLRTIGFCQREIEEAQGQASLDPALQSYLDRQTQAIIDGFCASIPYHLGDRTAVLLPHEHSEYPPVPKELRRLTSYVDAMGNPAEMTMSDHSRAAAAIGGWFLMTPLLGFLSTPLMVGSKTPTLTGPFLSKIRPGQLDWIRQQLQRIQKIYLLPHEFSELNQNQAYSIPPLAGSEKGNAWKRVLWAV
jgi:hypothetical protein